MPLSNTELLEQIDAAITAVLKNQSYAIGDRSFSRVNLGELRKMRKDVVRELAREERGGGARMRYGTPPG